MTMRNVIITYAEGNDFVEKLDSEIFLQNIKKHKTFHKIVFTRLLSQKNLEMLDKYFDEVIVCQNPIYNSARDRFMSYYLWMIENRCYLMDIFIKKFDRLYKDQPNPFKQSIYILDAMCFLYNRHYISTYNKYIKMTFDEEYQLLTLPKNSYRIIR